MEEYQKYLDKAINWLIEHGIFIGIILVVTLLLLFGIRFFIRFLEKKWIGKQSDPQEHKQLRTFLRVIRGVLIIILLLTALISIIDRLGFDIATIIAGAGVIGIAVGFGAQSLIKDLFNGFFILLHQSYNIGDVITVGGKTGTVEYISMRITKLRSIDGNLIIVPNGEITIIENMTSDWSMCMIDLGVAYKENYDEVVKIIKHVGDEMRSDPIFGDIILEDINIMGFDNFQDSQITIRIRFKTKAMRQWEVKREFNRRIKKEFDQLGIEIPFPHITLYIGTDKNSQGELKIAPPNSK